MRVVILNTPDGEWEGMFIDGKLIEEGEVLGEGENFMYMLRMSEIYGFKSTDVEFKEINDIDNEYVTSCGNFYDTLDKFDGDY